MKGHRARLIEAAVVNAELPLEFASLLVKDAPWLDGTEELNEEFGPELFAEEAAAFGISSGRVLEFVERYNKLVQSQNNPHALRQNEAYIAIGQILVQYGRADAFGEGDYWLVADSFSTRNPVIVVFEDFQLPPTALLELQELMNQYNGIFSELRINTDFGAEITALRPR